MNDTSKLWDDRGRFLRSPPRYQEVISKNSIKNVIFDLSYLWKKNREKITYLDLGSGECEGAQLFLDFLRKTTGLQVNAIAIDAASSCEEKCKERGFDFIQLDLGSDLIPVKNMHVITLFETIEHIYDTDFLLKSIRNAISDDGIFFISTLNVVSWKNRILVPLGIQPLNTEVSLKRLSYGYRYRFLKNYVDAWAPAGHIRPFTLYSLLDILEDSGFQIVSTYGLENWRAFKFLESVSKNMCSGILVLAKPN